ncbi:MAG: hypothetical protein ACFFDW_10355 [Candidatus Thorarchaeota archaeon]
MSESTKTMAAELLPGEMKRIEKMIIQFYKGIGEKSHLNQTNTEIFAYLQLYKNLTQEQLKKLTKFSGSTISTTLQSFLQTEVIMKEIAPQIRKGIYKIRTDKVSFVYTPFSLIIQELEQIDLQIVEIEEQLQLMKFENNSISAFYRARLNSIRNFVEAQRRAINGEKRYDFFDENVPKEFEDEVITLPEEISKLETKMIQHFGKFTFFTDNDSIKNLILYYFMIRRNLDQETLIDLTNFSRSTVSRVLQKIVDEGIISALPKEFQKSRIYTMEHFSLALIKSILATDDYIFSWKEKFQQLKQELERFPDKKIYLKEIEFLQQKVAEILEEIEVLRLGSTALRQARNDLLHYLGKNTEKITG